MTNLMENYERYFGKIFADLIKRLVEEDECRARHVDGQALAAKPLSQTDHLSRR